MDNPFFIKDNSSRNIDNLTDSEKEIFSTIANKSIKSLLKENENLIIYSNNNKDKIEDQTIFKLNSSYQLEIGNLVGFIGMNNTKINIGSRFSETNSQQFFIQYMLQKINKLNLFDFNSDSHETNIWEQLLYYIFPVMLKKAYTQGLFKVYQKTKFNDSKVKGRIDIHRHLKTNIPFNGNISYSNKELSFNNPLTQLIRHTIEFISFKGYSSVLKNDFNLNQAINTIKTITPNYSRKHRQNVMLKNFKRVNHPFYTEYEPLRKICIQILNFEGLSFNNNHNKVYGLLIDASWLWEEYLNTVLVHQGFIHPENKTKRGMVHLFDGSGEVYPDFYNLEKSIVIDAKYKKLHNKNISREDNFQVITYMYRLKTKYGIVLYPTNVDVSPKERCMNSLSYGGIDSKLIKYGFNIPEELGNYKRFVKDFSSIENSLKNYLQFIDSAISEPFHSH